MLSHIKRYLTWIFYMLFSLCFLYLALHIVIHNTEYGYEEITLVPFIFISLGILVFAYCKIKKHETLLEKRYIVILGSFLSIMAVLQLVFGNMLRFTPAFDLDAIYGGAIAWAETGTFANYYEYFYYFPNNLGGLSFLRFFFSIAKGLGITDYFMVATVVNCFLSISTMFVVASICKKILGTRYAITALVFFAVSLPFYFIAAVFYTDALSMLFPALFYYLYLLSKDAQKTSKQIMLYLLMGLTAGVGMELKFTVFIMVIAVMIDSIFFCKGKKTILMAGITGALILLIFTCTNAAIYGKHLEKENAKIHNTPYLHWVMMGLKGNGGYNPEDYEFTRSFTNRREQNKALLGEIGNRIKALGAGGMSELLTKKGERCFGDGTYALSDFLDDTPKNNTFLHKYVLYAGEKYKQYSHICEGVLMAIFILMICSGFQEVLLKEKRFSEFLAPRVAVFGILLFLIFWEVSGRYFSNFIPMIFISALMGMDYFIEQAKKLLLHIKHGLCITE